MAKCLGGDKTPESARKKLSVRCMNSAASFRVSDPMIYEQQKSTLSVASSPT